VSSGPGLGTEARAAILALAFDGLGADAAESGYFEGNAASARVSEKLGYRIWGNEVLAIEGKTGIGNQRCAAPAKPWRRARPGHDRRPGAVPEALGVGDLGPDEWATL